MIAAVDHGGFDGYLAVWDAESGELMHTQPRDDNLGFGPNDLIFTPDSQGLILAHGGKGARQRLSTETWEVVTEVSSDQSLEGGGWLGFIGVAPDGTLVGVGGFAGLGAGALHWFDIETLEAQRDRSKPQIHDAAIKAVAMSPDGSLMATGAADGFVRVWDARTGILEHEVPFGRTQVQGVAFIDDSHLAVTPEEGNLYVVTIDTDELLEIVRESLTRGFTTTECSKFSFGDRCPSLAELRGD
jgi:WD40 repeat protein